MDNKKLNDGELEQVNGGQNFMPIILAVNGNDTNGKEEDYQMLDVDPGTMIGGATHER